MTDAESLLWRHVRGNQLGVKFRRQHPFGRYILDFYSDQRIWRSNWTVASTTRKAALSQTANEQSSSSRRACSC
jgi:hypothetical protein